MLYASVGHAGASGYLAAMALFGVSSGVMKPSALVLNLLVASIGTVQFARANKGIALKTLLPFALGSVPLAFLGGLTPPGGWWYRPLVGLVLLAASVRLTLPEMKPMGQGKAGVALPVLLGALIGVLAGLTGTGGGIFLTPLLLFTGWESGKKAAGVSATFILLNSLAGLAAKPGSLARLPSSFWLWALAAVSGGLIGASVGSTRFSTPVLRRVLALVLLIAAGKLLLTR